jgi:hypothetical protein
MIRVAIFTEGQSELIFTRNLLFMIFNYQYLSIDCLRLHSGRESRVYSHKNPQAKYYFQIVAVGNDSKVISYIREQFDYLVAMDFEIVIGVRDLYSKAYRKRSKVVDEKVNRLFIDAQTKILDDISGNSNRIKLFFEIMEFEAWLLSMPHLFEKIDPQLTIDFIEQSLGFDLETIAPQYEFIHPAMQFGEILQLIGVSYKKSKDQLESIISRITSNDIDDALENGKCPAFSAYFSELYGYSITQS